jgi:hypothetical protein
VDETPVDETPVDETPVDETPVDSTPVDETPVDNTPVDSTPADDPHRPPQADDPHRPPQADDPHRPPQADDLHRPPEQPEQPKQPEQPEQPKQPKQPEQPEQPATLSAERRAHLEKLADEIGTDFKDSETRQQYEADVAQLKETADQLKTQRGESPEALWGIARYLWNERRRLATYYKDKTPEPLRDYIYYINQKRYRDPLGIKWEWDLPEPQPADIPTMLSKYGDDYNEMIRAATTPNPDIDVLLARFREWLLDPNNRTADKY